jgi:hypothetical protein
MKTNLKYFILLLLFSFNVFAASTEGECSYQENSEKLGEVRNQGQIGWCYANAAADLLTFRYHKELKGQKVSQAHVALTFNYSTLQSANAEGGFGFAAMLAYLSQQKSLCPQSVENKVLAQGEEVGLREKLVKINRLKLLYDAQVEDQTQWKAFFDYLTELKKEKSIVQSMGNELLFDLLRKSSVRSFTYNLANALCEPHSVPISKRPNVDMDSTYVRLGFNGFLIDTIHAQLEKKNILAVAYHASIFKSPEIDSNSKHMSVIVGQRWNKVKQTCEYKIRNSWGNSCAPYTNPVFQEPGACEEGNVWIAEELLKETMYGLSYLLPEES